MLSFNIKNQDIYSAFKNYIEFAERELLFQKTDNSSFLASLKVYYINKNYWLRQRVETLEESDSFKNLIKLMYFKCYGRIKDKISSNTVPILNIRNYFRRSGLYLKLSIGEKIEINEEYYKFVSACEERDVEIIRIRAIDGVKFDQDLIEFKNFKIQRLTKVELDILFDNEISKIFFPSSVVDTLTLSNFWLVIDKVIKHKKSIYDMTYISDMDINFAKIIITSSDMTLRLLSLCDWESKEYKHNNIEDDLVFQAISLTSPIVVEKDYVEYPHINNLKGLSFIPVTIGEEEVGEGPLFELDYTSEDINTMREIISKAELFLDSINFTECKWDFIQRSLNFLAIAFQRSDFDQLLSNITAIEALLGEKENIVSNIGRRMAIILGNSDYVKIKRIKKDFRDLYDYRSKIIHGSEIDKPIYYRHLSSVCNYARSSLLWFIKYLFEIHNQLSENNIKFKNYPNQKQILSFIDYKLDCVVWENITIKLQI